MAMAPFYIGGEKWNHGEVYTNALQKFMALRQQEREASAQASVAAERNDIEREQLKQQMVQNELQRQFQANEAERERGWRTGERKDTQGFTAGEANAQRGWEGGFREKGLDLQRRGVEMQERGDMREADMHGLRKQHLNLQVKAAAIQSQYLPDQLKQALARDDLSIQQLKQAIDRGTIDMDVARKLAPFTVERQQQEVERGREDLAPEAVADRGRARKAGTRLAEAQAADVEARPAEADKQRMMQLHLEATRLATNKDTGSLNDAEYGRQMRLGMEALGKPVPKVTPSAPVSPESPATWDRGARSSNWLPGNWVPPAVQPLYGRNNPLAFIYGEPTESQQNATLRFDNAHEKARQYILRTLGYRAPQVGELGGGTW
jgi:hypothetical protein